LAVTLVSAFMVTLVGFVVPLSAPPQPKNVAPTSGCAVSVTTSPQL